MAKFNKEREAAKEVRPAKKAARKKAPAKKKSAPKGKGEVRRRLPPAERKLLILEQARQVFVKRGLHGARTKEIADAAGITEATLFHYFPTKEAIFDEAISTPLRELASALMARSTEFSETASDTDKERSGQAGHLAILESMDEMSPLLIHGLIADQALGRKVYKEDVYPAIVEMSEYAKRSFDTDQSTAEFIVLASLGISFAVNMHHKLLNKKQNKEEMAEMVTSLFIKGMAK